MAEETTVENDEQTVDGQDVNDGQDAPGTDWKKMARKWEALAKKNKGAAAELEEYKQTAAAELEALNARADKAEQELADMRAKMEKSKAVKAVSESSGVPAELLEFCSNQEEMQEMANTYKANTPHIHAAATVTGSRIVRDGAQRTPRDAFADWARDAMHMA